MEMDKINEVMQDYVKNQEVSGAALLVRRGMRSCTRTGGI